MKNVLLLVAFTVFAACIDPPPDTATDEQSACTQEPVVAGEGDPGTICQQQPSCTPISGCTDAIIQAGLCCPHYGTPTSPSTAGAAACGNDLDGIPTCIVTNTYFDGTLVQIKCTTVTQWFSDGNGGVTTAQDTECTYY